MPPTPQPGASPANFLSITTCMHANSKGNVGLLLEKKPQSVPLEQGTSLSAGKSLLRPGRPPLPSPDPSAAPSKPFSQSSLVAVSQKQQKCPRSLVIES